MTDVSNFKSLLFYFGLLSIKGVDMMGRPILHVPNLVVREQLFNFLIQGYARHDVFKLDVNRLFSLFENMSFKGDWKPLFEFVAGAIREQSRIREYIEVTVMPPYTYLLEVKYAKAGASDKEIRMLADDAREQLIRYSGDECVAEAQKKGGLKLITVVWRSWELALAEEVEV